MKKKIIVILVALFLFFTTNIFAYAFISTDSNAKRESREEIEATKSNSEKNIYENDIIYQVSFPANIYAYLDPENISGKGQVFSDKYEVKNYSNVDIAIKIKNISVLKNETLATCSNAKEDNINIIWENTEKEEKRILSVTDSSPDECVLYLKAAEYNENGEFVNFNIGSTGQFYFEGTLGSMYDWKNDELSAVFDYEIISKDNEVPVK